MKKPVIAIFIFLLVVGAGIASGSALSVHLTPEEKAWLNANNGKIRLGHDPDARPIDYTDAQGRFKGLAADYVHLIEKKLNFQFNILHLPTWDEVVKKAKNREIDVLCSFTKNEKREQWMLFTPPYIEIKTVILTHHGGPTSLSLETMKNLKVTFTKGWVIEDYLRKEYPNLNMQPAIDSDEAMNNLLTEKADAWITALTVAVVKIEDNQVTNIQVAGETPLKFKLAMASRKDWPILNRILTKGLAMVTEHERAVIFKKWIHIERQSLLENQNFWIVVFSIIGLSLFVVIVIYSWNTALKKKVAEKTKALQESEDKFKYVFDYSVIGKSITSVTGEIQANQAFYKMLGYTREELSGLKWKQITHPDDVEKSQNAIDSILSGEKKSVVFNKRYVHKNGSTVWAQVSTTLRRDADGSPLYLITAINDMTRQKQAEIARQESEAKYRTMMESITDPVYICSPEFTVEYMNPAMVKRTGRDAVGEKCHKVLHDLDSKCRWCVFDEVRKGEIPESKIVSPLDNRQYRIRNMPVYNPDGTISKMTILRDITDYMKAVSDKENAQKQLLQSQKLESIGKLAGGIAHDFNNMLSIILGYGQELLSSLHKDDPLYDCAKEIVEAGNRSASLTRQLLAFSRRQALKPDVLNLNHIIKSIEKVLRRLLGEDIDLKVSLLKDLDNVFVDPGQIEQVIMNLCVNARDAMPRGGKLTIETMNASIDKAYASRHIRIVPGEYVLMTVSDTGHGIDPEIRERIFEPFFTTKSKDKGTGLGLSTVYGIVKQSNGYIWVYSEPDKGTSFKIYLPKSLGKAVEKKAAKNDPALTGNGEKILVVEDEQSLRKLCLKSLKSFNYDVTVASNGGEALLMIEAGKLKPDLILTDVVMPELSGKALADRLRKNLPDLKVLFMSGYTDDNIVHHGILDSGTPFIQKPFNQKTLAEAVKKILYSSNEI